jgi:hypothetical protein
MRTLARSMSRGTSIGAGALPARSRGSDATRLRRIERKRRLFLRLLRTRPVPPELFVRLTVSSFALEDLVVSEEEVASAMGADAYRRGFRPLRTLRIRNHVAILRRIEKIVRLGRELSVPVVVRWYTLISCGLSMTLDEPRIKRLEQTLRRINSPQLRLQPAVHEIAALHVQLLLDPLFPGFNGILARLLLQFHLARCQLPPAVFDPAADRSRMNSEVTLAPRVMDLIAGSYEWLLTKR